MKYKISILIFVLHFQAFCKNRLDIYLGFNECITCFSALGVLGSINNCEKRIVICRDDSTVSREFLANYSIPKDAQYLYVDAKGTGFSY